MLHPYSLFRRKSLRTISILVTSMTAAFVLGIKTAGDVQPVIDATQADSAIIEGDMNGNGMLDADDAALALQVSLGYVAVTPSMLDADPNHDFHITADDALTILGMIGQLPTKPQVDL
ncbi:MAG: hypothetical protein PHZ00_02080 [Candidatus Peribacteraceae bacterium]|nr:hypothetical protein [Candidatus Peribacteraceae bacterium]